MEAGKTALWLRWNWKEAAGLALISILFIFATYRGTNPEKSPFLDLNPRPDCVEYAVESNHLFHNGNEDLSINGHFFPSRYPIGFPLALAVLHPLLGGSTWNVIAWAPILFMVAGIWVLYALLRHCSGAAAAWMGTLFFAANPCIFYLTTGLYSESLLVLVSLLTAGFFVQTVQSGKPLPAILFGVLFGFSLVVRTQVIITAPLFLAAYYFLPAKRPGLKPAVLAMCSAALFLGVQAFLQWKQFGSPMTTGYSFHIVGIKMFSPSYFHDNLMFYVPGLFWGRNTVCTGVKWVYVPILLIILSIAGMIYMRKKGGKAVVVSFVFVAMTLGFFCCYLFKDIRFFIQVLLLLFAWAGIGAAGLVSRFKTMWKIPALLMIAGIYWKMPIGNHQPPSLFATYLRALPQKSYLYLNMQAVFRAVKSDSASGEPPVLLTAENLVLLDFYSPGLILYPVSRDQEYARVPKLAGLFPESIDSLLKNHPVYTTDSGTMFGQEAKAFEQLKEDFVLSEIPCHLEGGGHVYKITGRKQTNPGRNYWGG